MSIVLALMGLVGVAGAALLMLAAIVVVRIAIARRTLFVGAIGFAGICAAAPVINYWLVTDEPFVWWRDVLISVAAGMALFVCFLALFSATWILRYSNFPMSRAAGGLSGATLFRAFAVLLATAVVLTLLDLQTGFRGWGPGVGGLVLLVGLIGVAQAHLLRHFLAWRLAEIDDSEPELLASLKHGRVSRHVLRAIRHWTEVEEKLDSRQSQTVQ